MPDFLPSTSTTHNGLDTGLPGSRNSGSLLADDDKKKFDLGGFAGMAAPLALSLFAPDTRGISPEVNKIESQADTLKTGGAQDLAAGRSALAPVLDYFKNLVGGDNSAIMAATAPDRARVIDQYDTSKKAIASFAPRGGGAASSINENRTREASDLATTTATARSNAATQLGSVGNAVANRGMSEEEASIQALASTLQPLLASQNSSKSDIASLYGGLGKLIGASLFK